MKNDDFQEGKMVADGRFLGGDPTKNCNFQSGKVGLLWSKNFKSCVPRKLLCKERLLTQPSLSFASFGTSGLNFLTVLEK